MFNGVEMDKEVRFAELLESVKRTAREQGNCISEDQVKDAFKELDFDDNRLSMVLDYLKSQHIGIGEAPDPDEYMSDEEKDYLQIYLDELNTLKDYSDGEKKAYTIQAMTGDEAAQSKLIEIYLKSVVDIAHIYAGQGVLIEDLIGEGNVALSVGVTMIGSQETPEDCEGMLTKLIMDAMEELIKDSNDSDDVEKKALKRVNDIYDKAEKLSKEYARKVTVEELCEEEHLSRKAVIDALRISGFAIDSIEVPEELKGKE